MNEVILISLFTLFSKDNKDPDRSPVIFFRFKEEDKHPYSETASYSMIKSKSMGIHWVKKELRFKHRILNMPTCLTYFQIPMNDGLRLHVLEQDLSSLLKSNPPLPPIAV